MIKFGNNVFSVRWSSDGWIRNGNKEYIKFTRTVRPYVTTYGFIFFNLAMILGIANNVDKTS
jgi:hypothetical protein